MPKRGEDRQGLAFAGFDSPEANFFRMPNNWTDVTAGITNIAELKVVEYILRHTWGYQEFEIKKHITVDEFVRGRKRADSTRIDRGTGLSERAVRYGLQDALADGLIEEDVDDSDRARVKKFYSLRMRNDHLRNGENRGAHDLPPGVQTLHPRYGGVQSLPPRGADFAPRSEKETSEKYFSNSNIRKSIRSKDDFVDNSPSQQISRKGRVSKSRNGAETHPDVEGIASIMARVAPQLDDVAPVKRQRGRPRKLPNVSPEIYEAVVAVIKDYSRKLGDGDHTTSNITQAANLIAACGCDFNTFYMHVIDAYKITCQRNGLDNRSGYFFTVLRDRLLPSETVGSQIP